MMVQPAFLSEGLLNGCIKSLDVTQRLGNDVQHLPSKMLQLWGESDRYGWFVKRLHNGLEELGGCTYFSRFGENQQRQGDVERHGADPVRFRLGQVGQDLGLKALVGMKGGGGVDPKGDEVSGSAFLPPWL